jgi:hypothetical protein
MPLISITITSANSQGTGSAEVEQLRQEVTAQRQMIEELKATVQQLAKQQQAISENANALSSDVTAVLTQATQANLKAGTAEPDANGHRFLEHKKGTPATFYTKGGEITAYGSSTNRSKGQRRSIERQ